MVVKGARDRAAVVTSCGTQRHTEISLQSRPVQVAGQPALEEIPFCEVTDSDDNIDFNVSHHGDWVVLAACTNGKIGVDVTRRDVPKEDVDSFVNYFTDQLAEDEIQRLHSTKDKGLKLQLFYEIWCLKESLIKALGLGLHKDLKYTNFMPVELGEHADEDKCNISLRDSQEPENSKLFRFNLSYIDKDHPVAICTSAQSSGAGDNLSRSGLRLGQSYADAQACGTPFSIISFNQIIQCTASKPDQ